MMNGSKPTSFSYDADGNMTTRTVDGVSYTLAYDAENRLVSISGGGLSARYSYNGDGERVQAIVTTNGNTRTTAYLGDYFEVSIGAPKESGIPTPADCSISHCIYLPSIIMAMAPIPAGHAWTSYYSAGGSRIAQWVQSNQEGLESGVYYLLSDHLGSTRVTVDGSGNLLSSLRYTAFGEVRAASSTAPTIITTPGNWNR